ncbi:MAG: guanylate kinase [Deltaproteobacteria bacterium]|nr:guanylate kinase [Deltaproteobacteria bacterium]
MQSSGQLFVLSGPSGVGKSSLRENVRKKLPRLAYSISHTTRPPRHGEREGRDYHFVSEETFLTMRQGGSFVEWAFVHGNYYGTSADQLELQRRRAEDVLLEIDVQGARQVKMRFPHACFIFVLPPDRETLKERLLKRGTEEGDDLETRLENAMGELLEASWYDYLVVNDDLDEAVEALKTIILAAHYQREVVLPQVKDLLHLE